MSEKDWNRPDLASVKMERHEICAIGTEREKHWRA